ncbi:MAG: hypothetical protein M1814_003184 [Vezdaea aestivalis]|nr:MAG: hypothetical protein M1814_003184 [Vezdaea aestivalis]
MSSSAPSAPPSSSREQPWLLDASRQVSPIAFPPANVIDLTGDDPNPSLRPARERRPRTSSVIIVEDEEIVDVDALPDSIIPDDPPMSLGSLMASSRLDRHLPHPFSNSQPTPGSFHHHHHHHHHHAPHPLARPRPRPGPISRRPGPMPGGVRFGPFGGELTESLNYFPAALNIRPRSNRLGFDGLNLNYDTIGFSGVVDSPIFPPGPPNLSPMHRCSPPPPAKDGFTRSPAESEEVVCPNCNEELAIGDTKEQRAVYVVKKCGHAYCGTCTLRRKVTPRKSSGKKGSSKLNASSPPPLPAGGKSRPFTRCVVDGCSSSTAASNSMIQIYL